MSDATIVPVLLKEPAEGVPNVIDTLQAMYTYCELLSHGTGPVAADAERASGFRYDHKHRLIQLKRQGTPIGLLDTVALDEQGVDWSVLSNALGSATWIIHDAIQDLAGFRELGLIPASLFDTHIAARMSGLPRVNLAAVSEHFLSVTLAKEHSAADWSYRPLPRSWRNYAALDVEVLIELEKSMRHELARQGKLAWVLEECTYVLHVGLLPKKNHPAPWVHISRINTLIHDKRGLAIAKALWERRDELARYYDIAPNLLLSDSAIVEAARRKPHNSREFRAIRSLNERVRIHTNAEQAKMFERYAPIQRSVKPSVWKHVIQQALTMPEVEWPRIIPPRSPQSVSNAPKSLKAWYDYDPQRAERLKRVKEAVERISKELNIPVQMLIKPHIIRNICWQDVVDPYNVRSLLAQQGARNWQISVLAESVSRAIM